MADCPGLTQLKIRCQNNPGLQAFFTAHYENPVRHLIGFKQAPSAQDYPSICYVPNAGLIWLNKPDAVLASVIIGLCEEDETDGVMDGVSRLFEAQALLVKALTPVDLGGGWHIKTDEPIRTATDLAVQHPFYHLELHIPLRQGT